MVGDIRSTKSVLKKRGIMFSSTKRLLSIVNKKGLLVVLLMASPALFIPACGTWDKGVTGPLAVLTLTPGATSTPTSACPNPAAVNLGGAGNYVLLAESAITDTGSHSCVITGNVGNSGGGSAIGVNCPEVTGTIYEPDAGYTGTNRLCGVNTSTLSTDATNMGTAYTTDCNGQPYCVLNLGPVTPGLLNGVTITRGVYKWDTSTSVNITGDIYLDAQGNSSNRWVFQLGQNLTLGNGVTIHLINGALAQNVFWTVAGSSATLGTTSQFVGILLAGPICGIVVNTNASVNGRLLSQTAITLDANTITQAP